MPARTGCCCGCTLFDQKFDDPDGVEVIEMFDEILIQDTDNLSSQIADDGAPFTCRGDERTPKIPCREVRFDAVTDDTAIFAKGVTVNLGAGPAPFSGTIGLGSASGGASGGGLGYTSANLTPLGPSTTVVRLTGSGSDLTVECIVGAGEPAFNATYFLAGALTVHGWDSHVIGGINWRDRAQFTLNLTASDSGHTWPSAITVDARDYTVGPGYGGLFHHLATANIWWRFYDQTTWDPDGSDGPDVAVRMCTSFVEIYRTHLNDASVDTGGPEASGFFYLALKQGATRAYATPGLFQLRRESGNWQYLQFPTQAWSDIGWAQFDQNTATGATSVSFVPDVSNGAAPITLGICCPIRTPTEGALKRAKYHYRFDELCLHLHPT